MGKTNHRVMKDYDIGKPRKVNQEEEQPKHRSFKNFLAEDEEVDGFDLFEGEDIELDEEASKYLKKD